MNGLSIKILMKPGCKCLDGNLTAGLQYANENDLITVSFGVKIKEYNRKRGNNFSKRKFFVIMCCDGLSYKLLV